MAASLVVLLALFAPGLAQEGMHMLLQSHVVFSSPQAFMEIVGTGWIRARAYGASRCK